MTFQHTARIAVFALLACVAPAIAVEHKESEPEASLSTIRRIFVDQLGGGPTSEQMRDMIITALQNSGLFVVTENQERADAVLRGSSDDRVFTEDHNTSETIGFRAGAAAASGARSSSVNASNQRASASAGVNENESMRIQERKHEAAASIRLVNGDGDVVWSTTQESTGGKFRGAMADVADRIARQLVADAKKARLQTPAKN